MSTVRPGDRVQIHYQTRSRQGNMIETSEHREPYEFIAGTGEVVVGLNQAVMGMRVGERKHLILSPDLAFGYRDPQLQQMAPRGPVLEQAEEGDQFAVCCGSATIDVWVRGVQDEEVILDANHPLAGESLVVDFEVIGICHETHSVVAKEG